jgi:hypothetical protein
MTLNLLRNAILFQGKKEVEEKKTVVDDQRFVIVLRLRLEYNIQQVKRFTQRRSLVLFAWLSFTLFLNIFCS